MIAPSRRGLITGLISLVAAPAVVKASSLMPVKAIKYDGWKIEYFVYPPVHVWDSDVRMIEYRADSLISYIAEGNEIVWVRAYDA